MKPVEAKPSKGFWYRVAVVGVMFGAIGFGLIMAAISSLRSRYSHGISGSLILLLFGLAVAVIPALMMVRSRRSWAWRFDAEGVTLGSGRRFAWSEFEKVKVFRRRPNGRGAGYIHRCELTFQGRNRAWVYALMLANSDEVLAVVAALQTSKNPFLAPNQRAPLDSPSRP